MIFLILFFTITNIFSHEIFNKLDARMVYANSLVCVGLDPDITKMPASIMSTHQDIEDKVYNFLTQVIDITAPHACSFKLQKAFFDCYVLGYLLLKKTVGYIRKNHPDIPVIIDCKIGDIDNTMKAYMSLLFEDIKADAVVINPYMGDEVLEPFMQDKNKVAVVLIKTSNPHADVVQGLMLSDGKKLWEEILNLTVTRWNTNKNLMIVVASNTHPHDCELIRKQISHDMPILLVGIGVQGGDPAILKALLNENKRGVIVNSSRGILYPYKSSDQHWKTAIEKAIIDLKNTLNSIRTA